LGGMKGGWKIARSSPFTGSADEPGRVRKPGAGILSADRNAILVPFIAWNGIRLLMNELLQLCAHGRLQIIRSGDSG